MGLRTISHNGLSMYRALSLFSGIGGLCEGFKLAGFQISGGVELDKYAAQSYRANFPDIPLYEGSVNDFLVHGSEQYSSELQKYVGGSIDVLFGGPPCQGFSQIGPRDPLDPRNELYLEMCRIAEDLSPKVIVIENVPNLLLMKKGLFKQRIIKSLKKIGYSNIALLKLAADEYGVPQSRNRVFFIAVKDEFIDISAQSLFESIAESLKKDKVTVSEALNDLPETVAHDSGVAIGYPKLNSSRVSAFMREMRVDLDGKKYLERNKKLMLKQQLFDLSLLNHHTKDVQARRLEIIKMMKPGAKANSLPKDIWNNKRPEKWRRFDPDKPAHTLLANMHRDLSEWIHHKYDRWITVREALRLQGFHDGFVLKTSEWQQLKQVGNAVPPFLGEVPATAARIILELGYLKKTEFNFKGQLSMV